MTKKVIPLILVTLLLFLVGCSSDKSTTVSENESIYNKGIQALDSGKYEEASNYFVKLDTYKDSKKLLNISAGLWNHQRFLNSGKTGDEAEMWADSGSIQLSRLTPQDYGKYAEKIKVAIRDLGSERMQFGKEVVEKENNEENEEQVYPTKERPAIGMTKDEVLNSTWGTPKDINRTTTSYGIKEQWVYSIGRYVYFEDGVVTAIQD